MELYAHNTSIQSSNLLPKNPKLYKIAQLILQNSHAKFRNPTNDQRRFPRLVTYLIAMAYSFGSPFHLENFPSLISNPVLLLAASSSVSSLGVFGVVMVYSGLESRVTPFFCLTLPFLLTSPVRIQERPSSRHVNCFETWVFVEDVPMRWLRLSSMKTSAMTVRFCSSTENIQRWRWGEYSTFNGRTRRRKPTLSIERIGHSSLSYLLKRRKRP